MTSLASQSSVKVIGANGQISLGKQFAGRQVLVEESEPGVWMVRTATVVPDNERWVHEAKASADLGAGLWQTFRLVTFPQFRTAFVAGALLAFALSFDEVVVTIFTAPPGVDTLPLWILKEMSRPNNASVVNVVATVVILISLIPVFISQRLTRAQDEGK